MSFSLNPNHAVTRQMEEHWHKITAMLVQKNGGHVVLSLNDVQSFPQGGCITIQELDDGIHLRIVDARTGEALARKEGGLPT